MNTKLREISELDVLPDWLLSGIAAQAATCVEGGCRTLASPKYQCLGKSRSQLHSHCTWLLPDRRPRKYHR